LDSIERLAVEWRKQVAEAEAGERALASYCHAVLNSAEFLYVD
jgi:hypothetical protein